MKRYLSSIKQYCWILLVCLAVTTIAGYLYTKSQPAVYQASATMYVEVGAPGTTYSATGAAQTGATDSITQASNYSSEIMTGSVMSYVYQSDPKLKSLGYTATDLLADMQAVPSTTSPTIVLTASTTVPNEAVLIVNDVANSFQNYVQTIRQAHLKVLRDNLQGQLAVYQKTASDLAAKIQQLNNTSDPRYSIWTADRADAIHNIDTLQGQILQLPTSIVSDVNAVQLADPGTATPSSKTSTIVAIFAAVGLILGVVIMLLLIFLDNRLRNEDQVSERLNLAYLGGVSKNNEFKTNPTQLSGVALQEIADIGANLRLTNVLPDGSRTGQGTVVLITSAQSTAGRSSIASALASNLARGGMTVAVVDGNLREPTTHLSLGMSPTGFGLSGLLKSSGGENIDTAVQRTNIPNVWFLPGGTAMENATPFLTHKFPLILAQLRKKAELVIIDGPALLSGADASLLAGMSDGVVLVVDSNRDRLSVLQRAKNVLTGLIHTPAGVILNYLPARRRNRYYATAYPVDMDNREIVQVHASNGNGNGQKSDGMTTIPSTPAGNMYGAGMIGNPQSPVPMDAMTLQQGQSLIRHASRRTDMPLS